MLQACLNGGLNPAALPARLPVPVTPAQLAADAAAVRAAGADCLHFHPRGAAGAETLAPGPLGAALTAVRAAVPGLPVGVGTGAWIAPCGRARQADIAAWQERPDYASVNLCEDDAPEVIALLMSLGVGVEAGLWCAADAERFVALAAAPSCLRVLIEMTAQDPAEARAGYRATRAVLTRAGISVPILLHGEGGSAWAMVEQAVADGLDTRIGFEDVLLLPDGTPAPDNAKLILAARALGA